MYIYHDVGASQKSVLACKCAIAKWTSYDVLMLNAPALLQGEWAQDAWVLVMPGGADLPYGQKLNGKGNGIIKQYVDGGGTYLGICAGAYYASAYCDFHRGDNREVLGARELAFYPGSAVGPTLADYDENSEDGMRKACIQWENNKHYHAYFNGGCHFPGAELMTGTEVKGCYVNDPRRVPLYGADPLPAVLRCFVGKGQAILCGVHPEYTLTSGGNHLLLQEILKLIRVQSV